MAFHDWNNNGKKDFVDDYIEYNIYKESTGSDNNSFGSGATPGNGEGCVTSICMIIAIIVVYSLLFRIF